MTITPYPPYPPTTELPDTRLLHGCAEPPIALSSQPCSTRSKLHPKVPPRPCRTSHESCPCLWHRSTDPELRQYALSLYAPVYVTAESILPLPSGLTHLHRHSHVLRVSLDVTLLPLSCGNWDSRPCLLHLLRYAHEEREHRASMR